MSGGRHVNKIDMSDVRRGGGEHGRKDWFGPVAVGLVWIRVSWVEVASCYA